jgi:hypothetical protein
MTLFNLDGYNSSPTPIHDPYWDEIVKPKQLELIYDCPTTQSDSHYNQAWEQWINNPTSDIQNFIEVASSTSFLDAGTSLDESVGEQVKKQTAHQQVQWLERYWVKRSGKKYYYYRHSWMDGRIIHRCYIGAVKSPKSAAIVEKIRQAIARQESPIEIEKLIRCSKISTSG